MSSEATVSLRDSPGFTYYIRRLLNMQVKLLQVIHFDVRCHDMTVFEWYVFLSFAFKLIQV